MDIVSRLIGRQPDGGLPEFGDSQSGGTASSVLGDLRDALAARGESSVSNAASSLTGMPNGQGSVGEMLGLSWKNRILAAGLSGVVGLGLIFMSFWVIFMPRQFAKLYTIGSILVIMSTLFMVGPKRQCQSMAAPVRGVSFVIYMCSMVLTLYFAVSLRSSILTLIGAVVQVCAALYYAASYVPFMQSCLRACCGGISSRVLPR